MKIEEGKSTGGWTKAVMGEPTRTLATDAGTEVWEWTYRERKTVDAQLLVLRNESSVVKDRVARVEVKDGIVVNKWFSDSSVIEKDRLN